MMRLNRLFRALANDDGGTMIIETAIVAPVLVLMSLGAFQVSKIVSRQQELETAASEAAAIALSSPPDTPAKMTTLQQVIMSSVNLDATHVTTSTVYRCNSNTTYDTAMTSCNTGVISMYAKIYITDTYTPAWTKFGVGSPLQFNVTRYVMYRQQSAT